MSKERKSRLAFEKESVFFKKIPEVFNCEWYLFNWVVHGRDGTVGHKVLSRAANDTMEKLTNQSRVLRCVACRWCGIVQFVGPRGGRQGSRAPVGAMRRDVSASARAKGSSRRFLSLRMAVDKRARNFWSHGRLKPLARIRAEASWPRADSGLPYPRKIAFATFVGAQYVPVLIPLSNGSRPKSILIPAAGRCSSTGSFSLRERFRACSLA